MFETKEKKSILKADISIGGVSNTDIMLFTKHLSVALKSGVTIMEAIDILEGQAKGKLKKVIAEISKSLRGGDSLHKALGKHSKYFSPIYLNMVRSGELSGTLEDNLTRLSVELKKSISLKKKIKSAMIYPTFIFIAVFGLGMSVSLFVLPKILPLFKTLNVKLPLSTRALLFVAELFTTHGVQIVVVSTILLIMFFWLVRMNFIKPFTHWLILKTPIVNTIVKNVNLERFNRTFGTLLESGIAVDESLRITAQVIENRRYRSAILRIIPDIMGGISIKSATSKFPDLFPPITTKMIGIGEKTGNLSSTMTYLGEYYEEEVDEAVKNLSIIIEPVLLIFIGVLVGTVAIAILGPIYQITGSLRG